VKRLLILLLLAGPAWAGNTPLSGAQTVAPQQRNLQAVRKQIDSLQKDIAQKEVVKKQAQSAIQMSEQAIAATNQALSQLGQKKSSSSVRLTELQKQLESLQQQVAVVRQKVALMLSQQYKNGEHDAMRLMLNGSDPNQTSRDLVYYQYIARAQQRLVKDLIERQSALVQTSQQLTQQLDQLQNLSSRKAA